MITPESLSIDALHSVFSRSANLKAHVDTNGCLKVTLQDKEVVVAVIGDHQVRFLAISAVSYSALSRLDLLGLVNDLNADIALTSGAYLSEDDNIVFTQAATVTGGVSEEKFLTSLYEFAIECVIFDGVIEQRSSDN